eukprot:5775631-Pyramimonas_sp.AAC.1
MCVLQIKPGGTLMLEPECSTWVGAAMGYTMRGRGANILGDESRRDVLEANFVAEIMSQPQCPTDNPGCRGRVEDRVSDC